MQIQISDLLQLNIESNLQQNLEGSTILECSCSILMHRAIIFLWNESPLLWTHGWLVPCPLENPPPLHYWGQDWTGLEIEAQIPIFRRFLRKMATFKIFSSEMHRPFLKFSAIHWNDLSVRCWLIVWWNWFIHVFTVQPLPHYISSHLIFTVCTVLYQLQLYFISSYCAIAPIVL